MGTELVTCNKTELIAAIAKAMKKERESNSAELASLRARLAEAEGNLRMLHGRTFSMRVYAAMESQITNLTAERDAVIKEAERLALALEADNLVAQTAIAEIARLTAERDAALATIEAGKEECKRNTLRTTTECRELIYNILSTAPRSTKGESK